MKKCAVIGSINMDMVGKVSRFPEPGETLTGSFFQTAPGGKGANQAVALARLGILVKMAGRVGEDVFGQQYLRHFVENGVDITSVSSISESGTGIADIMVNDVGENFIVVVPGANAFCSTAWAQAVLPDLEDCDIFLMQLEIPLETVIMCARYLRALGKTVILDPAPAVVLPDELMEIVDYITPNETELEILTGHLAAGTLAVDRIKYLSEKLGCIVIHKHGAEGAYIGAGGNVRHVPGYPVTVMDTTAAGDTFNAGFAAGLARGWSLEDAVALGNAAGALSVTRFGAQEGMPTYLQALKLKEIGAIPE